GFMVDVKPVMVELRGHGRVGAQCPGERDGLLGFAEEDAERCRFGGEGGGELRRAGDLGDVAAAGLLGGFEGYAAPAFEALGGGGGGGALAGGGRSGGGGAGGGRGWGGRGWRGRRWGQLVGGRDE